ncbi:MAG: exodeoxyribonuclease V subunit gamma [Ignavibacteriaceae bacterium]|nr:exodeoxyribonuclease V subunit gamma [Ignavibacteriaceae bacterium]
MILTKHNKKSIDIDFEINQKLTSRKLDELLLVVPTNRKSRYLKKELIALSPGKASGKINIETIGTYSSKLLLNSDNFQSLILSDAAASILLKQAFQDSNLRFFSYYKNEVPKGTLDRIKNVISEYKRHGITSQALSSEASNLTGSEKLKANDIAEIYSNYQKKCNELKKKEIGDIYTELLKMPHNSFEQKFKIIYPEVDLIIINGFDEFTALEIEIINRTADIKDINLYLNFDYYSFNPQIFSHLDKCYKAFTTKGFKQIDDSSTLSYNEFQNHVREKLFKRKKNNIEQKLENNIVCLKAENRLDEIELIAKEIKKIILLQKSQPNSICVAFNLIQNYSSIIRDIFTKYEIPFNLTDRLTLSTSPIITALINFLEIIENDFYYKNIFRSLSLNYLQIPDFDLSNLLKASVQLKIVSGYKNWIDSLNSALRQSSYSDIDENGKIKQDRAVYNKALTDIINLFSLLKPFAKKLTIKEFNESFRSMLDSFQISRLLINSRKIETEKHIKAFEEFISTVDELLDLLQLEYQANQKFPLKFFLNHLRTAVSSARYNVKEKPGYGVLVTTINEIRGLKFDTLFISGLNDGDFPTRFFPEIFNSGTYQKSELNHQTEERYHFYQSLCSWNNRLYLTYTLKDERKELSPSNFLTEFLSLFKVTEKSKLDYLDYHYNKEDFLKSLGQLDFKTLDNVKNIENIKIDLGKIRHAIEIDKLRNENPYGESEYTGFIGAKTEQNSNIDFSLFSNKNYSITQLETYAACPYKYFAERVLDLKPPEEPSEEIEALELGSLLHTILYEFYTECSRRNIVILKANEEIFQEAENLLFNIAETRTAKQNLNFALSFFELEKILGIKGDRKKSILYKFLELERYNDTGYFPAYFELKFGSIHEGDQEFTAGKSKFRGKIDRVDVNHDNQKFKVIDYKLGGKKPTASDLYNGLSLQLPLYMYAAKKLIQAQLKKNYHPAGSEIYSLKFAEEKFGPQPISLTRKKTTSDEDVQLNENLINICMETIEKYTANITSGKFHLSILEDRETRICQWCSFRSICRIQETGS